MAISFNYQTNGLLNLWQRTNRELIWRFNQAAGAGAPIGACPVYIQDDREQIAESLIEAKTLIEKWLGYYHRPTWAVESIPFAGGYPWQLQTLRMGMGHFIEWGQRGATLIQAGASVVYSDPDLDGVNERATITVNNVADSADEIQIFFQVADGAPSAGDERYQIEPVSVTKSGTTVTIVGHRALFVKPSTIWAIPFSPSDPNFRTRNYADTAQPTGFVTAVDVYRVYNDTSVSAQIESDPLYDPTATNLGQTVYTSTNTRITDSRNGIFEARFDCPLEPCAPPYPEYVKVYYRSGLPLVNSQPDSTILRSIIRLTNANMYMKLCSFCPETANIWDQDRGQAIVAQRHVNNPFGTLNGQVAAWMTVLSLAEAQGGAL